MRSTVPVALLLALSMSLVTVSANHPQTEEGMTVTFDHKTGNGWWVEVTLSGSPTFPVVRAEAQDTDGPWVDLEKKAWGAWAASFRIEPGHEVRFRAHYSTGTTIESCWFSHPAGVEDCRTTDPRLGAATLIDFNGHERSNDVVVLDDGSAVIVGGGFVARYDADAKQIWSKQVPANVQAAATHDGDIFMTGSIQASHAPGNGWQAGPSGEEDVWAARWTPAGTTVWETSFGGTDRDIGFGIDVAPSGVVVVGGLTNSCDYPAYGPPADEPRECSTLDGVVTRLTALGNSAVYSQELDLGGGAYVRDLAVTDDDRTHIVATAHGAGDQPLTADARQSDFGGRGDGFYMVLDGFGEVQYATYMGGQQRDGLVGVRANGTSAWVTGYSASAEYPTTADALQPVHGGGMECRHVTGFGPDPTFEDVPCEDIVITRFDADHTIGHSTFYGDIYSEAGEAIAVGTDGGVHVTGNAYWTRGFPTNQEPIGPVGGFSDLYRLSLLPGGSAVSHAVRIGGSAADYDASIAVGTTGVWLSGSTSSWDIPTTPGAEQRHHGPHFDAYLARFDHDNTAGAASPFTFDHRGGNEWWVQVRITGDDPSRVQARDTGDAWKELTLRDWGDWAASFRVEPGHDVRFRAMADGAWHESCWFTHPAGVTPTGAATCGAQDAGDPFDASFSTPGGNAWWVEVYVGADEPLAGVDARVDGGAWTALEKRSWGAWAKSFHVEDGSLVQFRATSTAGDTDLSGEYLWPEGTKVS